MDNPHGICTILLQRDGVTVGSTTKESITAAVDLERFVHESNPELPDDYVVHLEAVDLVTGRAGAAVTFNVRVRKGAAP